MPKAVRALALASHPGPALVVTVVAAVLAVAVAYPAWRVVLITAAMLADQLSVGWSNDWIDAARDSAVARADKPIAAHRIARRTVAVAAFVALVLALALTIPLGPAAFVAHVVALGSAWSYNAGLKRTLFSVVPYIVSFGTLPRDRHAGRSDAALALVVGRGHRMPARRGRACHERPPRPRAGSSHGVRGFGHLLGARIGGLVSFGLLAAAGVLIAVGAVVVSGLDGWPSVLVIAGSVITLAIACLGAVLTLRGLRSRWLMRLIMTSAVVDVIALVAAGPVLSV